MRDGERRVTEDGLLLPTTAQILTGPDGFDPGSNGQYLEDLGRELAKTVIDPIWYVLRKGEGRPLQGSISPGDTSRLITTRIGFNRERETELYLYGRMKPGASTRLWHDRIPKGRLTEYGRRVWGWQVHGGETNYDVDVYHDDRGFYWTIQQDMDHASVGLEQRHETTVQVLAAVVDHLIDDGVSGLVPILRED